MRGVAVRGDADRAELRLLDALAATGHPPLETEPLDGWLLRAAGGHAKRANSVWPRGQPSRPLASQLSDVRDWYASRGLRPLVQAVEAAEPPDLETALERDGWARGPDIVVMVGDLGAVARSCGDRPGPAHRLTVEATPGAAWRDVTAVVSGTSGEASATALRIATAAGPSPAFVSVLDVGGSPVAVGRGVVDAGWLGVFGLATLPAARGQGHACAVLGGLAAHGAAHGATWVFLQVASENERALRMYERLGLRERSRYRYWAAPT